MNKRTLLKPAALLLAILMTAAVFLPFVGVRNTKADDYDSRVVDDADVLSASEEQKLANELDRVSYLYDADFAVVTVNSTKGQSMQNYAEEFFTSRRFSNLDNGGILLLLNFGTHKYWICTYLTGKDAVSEEAGLAYIEHKMVDEFYVGDYYKGFLNFADACGDLYRWYKAGTVLTRSNYDELTGGNPHDDRLVDGANLLSFSEETELRGLLNRLSEENRFEIAIVTMNRYISKSLGDYAGEYYDEHYYGYNAARDGVLMVINMYDRGYYICTTGYGMSAIDPYLSSLENAFIPYLKKDDFAGGFTAFANKAAQLAGSYDIENDHRSYLEDQYIYSKGSSTNTGGGVSEEEPVNYGLAAIVTGLIGMLVGWISTGAMRSKLNSVSRQDGATQYLRNNRFTLAEREDIFLYSNVTKTRIQTDDSSRGSYGGSFGGGGGSFGGGGGSSSHGGGGGHF